ncbi:hypothetical protein ACEPAH_7929 [Sanghuangporus vaninii]
MTEVTSAPAVAVPLMPTHSASSAEEIHDTEVVDVLKAELEKAVKGVDVSGVGVDPAQKLDELQERVRSGDTVPEEKVEKAEDPVLGLKEMDADTVDANDAAVPLVDADITPPPPSAGPTEESVPEVQAAPVEGTVDPDTKNKETGLEVAPDVAVSAVEPISESKDTEPVSESNAKLESEMIAVEAVVPHQQPETHIEAAKVEDIGEPEDIAAIKSEADAREDAKGEMLDKAAEETIEKQDQMNEPAEVSIKEETAVDVPAPAADEAPLVVDEAPATVEEASKEEFSSSALAEMETKPADEVAAATAPESVKEELVKAEEESASVEAGTDKSLIQVDTAPPESVPGEPIIHEAKTEETAGQDIEPTVEAKVASDAPAQEAIDVTKDDSAEESVEAAGPIAAAEESALVDTSALEPPTDASALEPAEINAEQDKAEPASNVESGDTAPREAQQEPVEAVATTVDDAAKRAYELAHAHANDEVILCTPTDEEIRAAAALESAVVPETETEEKEIQAEAEEPVSVSEPEVKESAEAPSEAFEKYGTSSIQEEVKEKEEAKEPEAPAISEVTVEEAPEAAPGVLPAEPESTEIAKADEPAEKVETSVEQPEIVVAEEDADAPAPIIAESTLAPESEDKPEEKEVVSSSEVTDEVEAPVLSAEGVAAAPADAENKENSKDVPKEVDAADFEDKVEEVSGSSADAPVEPVADVVGEAPSVEDVVVPKEEASTDVEADASGDSKPAEPANISYEVAVSEPVAAEAEEESPVDNDTTKDLPKEVEDEPKPTEAILSPDPEEAETSTAEVVSGEAAPVEEATQFEDKAADAAKEELVAEAAQEIPSTKVPSEEAAPTDAAESLPIREEDTSEAVETETPAPDIPPAEEPIATGVQAEDSGVTIETEEVFEPAATPATGWTVATEKAASSDVLAATIDEVDELLQEESAVEAAEEVEETVPEVQDASGEEPAENQEPTAAVSDRAEVQESTVVGPGEETVEDVKPVTVAEPAGIASAEQELAASAEDEAKPTIEHDERIAEAEEVRAPPSAEDASAATEGPYHIPEGTVGAPQAEAKPDSAEPAEAAHESEAIENAEEEPEEVEVIPDVSIETPTPLSETLSFISSDEDEEDEEDDVPVELRLAKAVGIPPGEVAKIPALSSSTPTEIGAEDEATTPTKIVDETKPDEGKVEEETAAGGLQEHETPTQSILFEQPEDAEVAAPQAVNVDMNASETPERRKSPWTSSYSVITQGASPVYPEEPEEVKEEPAVERAVDVVAEVPSAEEVSQPEPVEDMQVLASDPVAPAALTQTVESVVAETPASETITDEVPNCEETTVLAKSDAEQEVPTINEVHQAEPSDQTLIDEKPEAPLETVPAALVVDTSAKEVPDRPKSPWTPSYSVTKVGPGIPEPEELHLDADVPAETKLDASSEEQPTVAEEQAPSAHIEVTEVPQTDAPASESVPVVERPKSPYPPSYSVTQMGPGVVEGAATAGELEEGGSIADSNEPEMPSTPRSELRSVTPGFDTLSEVSESSHIPNPPDSPRTDPELTSLMEAEAKTPLVTGIEEENKPISPLSTPLLSAKVIEDLGEASEPLTEAAVSGIEDAKSRSLLLEDDAEHEAGRPKLTEYATEETIIEAETADNYPSQAIETEDSILSTSELTIPKVDVIAAHPALPVIVTNTLSTDSAYTQISDTFSPSQETGTNVTTPDVETMSVPKLHEGSEVESLAEETATHVSEQPSTVTPTGTVGKGKSLGVAHTLAMRSFPSAFAQTESPSASEQPTQIAEADTLEVDDQLSPLASRRRLESTASALAFPGGWVSTPVKKERASLETATGVFSKPVVEGASTSPVAAPPSTEPASEQNESKWRCIIM